MAEVEPDEGSGLEQHLTQTLDARPALLWQLRVVGWNQEVR